MYDSLRPHGLQHTRLLGPSLSPRVCSNLCLLGRWSYLTIPSSFCHPLLLLYSLFPRIRVFSNESALHISWPKYWTFSLSISPSRVQVLDIRMCLFPIYTLLYLKWITNKGLLCSTRNSVPYVVGWMGGEFGGRLDKCIRMAESLHCSTETVTTWSISYTPIQNKQFKNKKKISLFPQCISGIGGKKNLNKISA